jgi:hypothetical protein
MKALAVNYTTEMKSSTNFLQDIWDLKIFKQYFVDVHHTRKESG